MTGKFDKSEIEFINNHLESPSISFFLQVLKIIIMIKLKKNRNFQKIAI